MLRRALIAASLVFLAAPLAAQAPEGWQVRIDRSQSASDPDNTPELKFMSMGNGFHVTGGPAGTFWNPANTATGDYTLTAAFNLMKPSGHVNYYGLVFGGDQLAAAGQNYIYFIVAQNGMFQVRHRAGENVHGVIEPTAHQAIQQPGADGRSSNTLEVRVAGDTISYVVNGTVVGTTPKSGMTAKTDGIVGVRVNHLLDVHIEGFAVKKP
ncbi:MAG: hypothetical protein AB7F99_08245 [Vicinamibacterales bacterium]